MKYVELRIRLSFDEPMEFHVRPLYLIRSLLGSSLHALCCSEGDTVCLACPQKGQCLYSTFFEGHFQPALKPVHPFSLHLLDRTNGESVLTYSFILKVYGDAINNLPYIIASFVRAGQIGAGKSKTKYKVEIFDQDGNMITNGFPLSNWNEDYSSYNPYSGNLLVNVITPLRFRFGNKYGIDFSAEEFLLALRRRYISVISCFGNKDAEKLKISDKCAIENRNLRWNQATHWSARQSSAMLIGGAVGSFKLCGEFSAYDMMLLDFASKFSAGKSVSFGLGNIEVWKEL